jgi:hypothetical protein
MTEEMEASQSGIEDGGMAGPGAPTPLSALEVGILQPRCFEMTDMSLYRAWLVLQKGTYS